MFWIFFQASNKQIQATYPFSCINLPFQVSAFQKQTHSFTIHRRTQGNITIAVHLRSLGWPPAKPLRYCGEHMGNRAGNLQQRFQLAWTHLPEGMWYTWRIIPFSKWLITMVSKSPNWGCSPYKWAKWLINGGY